MSSDGEFAVQQPPAQESVARAPEPPATSGPQPQFQAVPQYQGQPQVQAAPQLIVPKNPALGVILSFFIPGVGSIVNGSTGRGVTILALYILGWILALFLIGIPLLVGAWIWGLVDGYLSAQRWNQAHGIVS